MIRFTLLVAMFVSGAALAAPPTDDASSRATGSPAAKPVAASANPGQLLPPLPPLASLPASVAASVDDAAPEPTSPPSSPPGKKFRRAWSRKAPEAPPVRMLVTEQSRKYLADVDRQLDAILEASPFDRRAQSTAQAVALSR